VALETAPLGADRAAYTQTCVVVSLTAFLVTLRLVPVVAAKTLRRGLSGLDINKRGTPAGEVPMPEATGLAAGAAFLCASLVFQWLQHATGAQESLLPGGGAHAGLVCVLAALFLGFVDDVLDVPWRVKLAMPTLASLPLLMAYTGHTGVVVPHPLRPLLGGLAFLDLGVIYKLYMLAVAVFCTNSINILAGVNGLEAGQTLVLALACAAHSLRVLASLPGSWPAMDAAAKLQAHALSLSLVGPLAGVSAGILCFNWYPSAVFVGDTFTLFAGMTLAVAGILGHYSETLLLLFAPQVFNFVYSLPQLAKIVPCPRHRLPRLDPATGLLHGSNDYNLVNLVLRVGGPRTEKSLATALICIQAACAVATFGVRHLLAGVYKG
jgi:UDP-N-acetylglucosamine--dolichyl-phosphate N-acetylglucosaminephosphotransferase